MNIFLFYEIFEGERRLYDAEMKPNLTKLILNIPKSSRATDEIFMHSFEIDQRFTGEKMLKFTESTASECLVNILVEL